MFDYFRQIGRDAVAVAKGMGVTLKYLFKPGITVQYPEEKRTPSPRYRGQLIFDKDTCTACNLCVKACPSECISLEPQVNEQGKRIAKAKWYRIDFGKCNYCRLCEEACPTKPVKSVRHSLTYDVVFETREEMLTTWRNQTIEAAGQQQ